MNDQIKPAIVAGAFRGIEAAIAMRLAGTRLATSEQLDQKDPGR